MAYSFDDVSGDGDFQMVWHPDPVAPLPQAPVWQAPITQAPVGSSWTQTQGSYPSGGLLGNYGQMSGMRGGNMHEALKSGLQGNPSALQGLLSTNPATPSRPTYNFSGE